MTGQRYANEAAGAEGETGARLSRRDFLAGGAAVGVAVVPLVDSTLAGATQMTRPPADKHHKHKHKHKAKARPSLTALPAPGGIYAAHADPADLGVLQAASLLQAGLLSSRELTAACQSRIAKRSGPVSFAGSPTTINAWIRLCPARRGALHRVGPDPDRCRSPGPLPHYEEAPPDLRLTGLSVTSLPTTGLPAAGLPTAILPKLGLL